MHVVNFSEFKENSVRIMRILVVLGGLCNGKFTSSLRQTELTKYVSCIKHSRMFLFTFPLAVTNGNITYCELTSQIHN